MSLKCAPFILLFCVMLSFPIQEIKAQQLPNDAPKDNEAVVLSEIKTIIQSSELINGIDYPFLFSSNMPDRSRMLVFRQLLDMNKQVALEGDMPRLQLMIYASNSLNQLDINLAERAVSGEVQLFLSDSDRTITDTETIEFSYNDSVPFNLRSELEGDWNAVRFHDTTELPQRNRWRDYGQPAIIVAATGVTIFLLFNLRS